MLQKKQLTSLCHFVHYVRLYFYSIIYISMNLQQYMLPVHSSTAKRIHLQEEVEQHLTEHCVTGIGPSTALLDYTVTTCWLGAPYQQVRLLH